ncbi:MAG: antitoxin YefM [Candidatus Endobugula sp.]
MVTRRNGDDVVVISKKDYSSMLETFHLMRSPTNAKRLNEAVNRDCKEQVIFTNTDELRNEIGL